ncbi:MAG: hypothetical protein KJN93_08650 [Alphaproteobacteria bacterium]|nr:hypothetical protein [Alphaproteobacteria bacterium]
MTEPQMTPADCARELLRDEPAFRTSRDFGPLVRQGAGAGPSVLIGDQSMLELYTGAIPSMLDYRMGLLAQPGDIVIVRQRARDFEAYLEDDLGLTGVTVLQSPEGGLVPVALQCRTAPRLREELGRRLRDAGTLTLRSYLTTGHEWRLAKSLGEETGCPVHIYGTAPRIGRRANDKLWFWRMARKVLGPRGVPPSFHAFGPAAAAARVARLRDTGQDVVIKVPSSAGGTGNLRLTTAMLSGLGLAQIHALIIGRLRAIGWAGAYPILVGVWERGVTQSPSAQVFIPLDAPPIVEGLFEQRVAGAEGEFVGAIPAVLPRPIGETMRDEATRLASVLQALGYFGWCSFDGILRDDETLHWIECNGRWSGVSIPLVATMNMIGHVPGGIAIAQDHIERGTLAFDRLLDRLDDLLFRKRQGGPGLVLTSPQNPAAAALSFNAVAVADDQATAEAILTDARDRLR